MFVRHPRLSDHRLGTDPFIRQTQVGIRNCMPKCRRAAGQRGYAIAPAVGLVTEKLAASQDELPFGNRLIVSNPGRISDRTNAKPVGAPFLDFPIPFSARCAFTPFSEALPGAAKAAPLPSRSA